MKSQGDEEKFDSSLSNHDVGVHKSDVLYVLEEISDFRSDPFTLIDLVLPANSYLIACTNSQIFIEDGGNSPYVISVVHLEPLFLIILFDITLFDSNFKFQDLSIMLVTVLIIFGVKNQAPQVSFKFIVGDSISVSSYAFSDIIFCETLDILEDISDYGFQ